MSIAKSHQVTRDNLAGRPTTSTVVKVNRSDIEVVEGPTQIKLQDIGGAFILGHPVNGILGTALADNGTSVVLGTAKYGSLTVDKVLNYNNEFLEYLRDDDFKDTTNTTATTDTSNHIITFADGNKYISETIFKNDVNLATGTIESVPNLVNNGTATYYLSARPANYITAYYPFINGSTADYSGNGYDGTLVGTGTILDNMDSTTGWTAGSGGSISTNSTIFKYGTGAMNLYGADTDQDLIMYKTIAPTEDYSNLVITYHAYVADQTTLDSFSSTAWILYLYDGATFNRYIVYKSQLQIGWNIIRVDVDNPDSASGVPDMTQVSQIRINVEGQHVGFTGITEGSLVFDYISHGTPVLDYDVFGNSNNAYYLPGGRYRDATNSFYIGEDTNITFEAIQVDYTEDVTWGTWFKGPAQSRKNSANAICFCGWGYNLNADLGSGTTGVLNVGVRSGSNTEAFFTNGSILDDTSHRVIFTYEASSRTITAYIDGVYDNSLVTTQNFNTSTDKFNIGSKPLGNNPQNPVGTYSDTFVAKGELWDATKVANDYLRTNKTALAYGGVWEEASVGTAHSFTDVGQELRYRIDINGGTATISSEDSEGYSSPIKISYTTRQ